MKSRCRDHCQLAIDLALTLRYNLRVLHFGCNYSCQACVWLNSSRVATVRRATTPSARCTLHGKQKHSNRVSRTNEEIQYEKRDRTHVSYEVQSCWKSGWRVLAIHPCLARVVACASQFFDQVH